MIKKDLLYGFNPVMEALKAGRREFFAVYVTTTKVSNRMKKILELAEFNNVTINRVQHSQLNLMAGTDKHQGIGASTGPYPVAKISTLYQDIDKKSFPFFLLLDNIIDPGNLGALIRTGLCMGMDGVIIPKDRSALPTPTVSKASAGALEHVRLARVTNMTNTIKELKKKGLWVAGMDMASENSIFHSDLTGLNAVVIGGEGKGIRPLVKKHCDILISIPLFGPLDSLNASVAGAIFMYEFLRQKKQP